jgi:hypothetical protein
MNKAIRAFIIMGLILTVVFVVCKIYNPGISGMGLWLAGGMFMVAFLIRAMGYLTKKQKHIKNS